MKIKLSTYHKKLLADTLTPVNIYLKLRDVFASSILLESSDYHGHENSLSFICCDPIASFQVANEIIEILYPGLPVFNERIDDRSQVMDRLSEFQHSFEPEAQQDFQNVSGLFGYMAYDAVRYFENVNIDVVDPLIPDILFNVYRYVIRIDHFSNELTLIENSPEKDIHSSGLDRLEKLIYSNRFSTFPFRVNGSEISACTDNEFMNMVDAGIKHCHRGDVFQVVASRRFSTSFKGDEFNVYRALRSINPSPYLFYFDFGNFKIFGSSPEAQIQINGREASIYPIAGTFRRTGNDQEDSMLAKRLAGDEKENAEHVMLVDLARNDLSRDARHVTVEVFKEIQYYSHVIHLVSKVTGKLMENATSLKIAADTFPAGTLSGAPKHKAMSIIETLENVNRSFYGGAIGFLDFGGDVNLAIMIRTFLSKDNTLTFQAGAGIVAKSMPGNELQEVNNKLEALRKALVLAEKLH